MSQLTAVATDLVDPMTALILGAWEQAKARALTAIRAEIPSAEEMQTQVRLVLGTPPAMPTMPATPSIEDAAPARGNGKKK